MRQAKFKPVIKIRANIIIDVGFEVFTAAVMKSIIFWDMTPCSPLSFNRRFGGTYRLHLQGRRNRFSKTSKRAGGKQNLFLRSWRWKRYVPPKRRVETQRTTRRLIPEDDTLHHNRLSFWPRFNILHNGVSQCLRTFFSTWTQSPVFLIPLSSWNGLCFLRNLNSTGRNRLEHW
jgi:hypothetical protein